MLVTLAVPKLGKPEENFRKTMVSATSGSAASAAQPT